MALGCTLLHLPPLVAYALLFKVVTYMYAEVLEIHVGERFQKNTVILSDFLEVSVVDLVQ